MASKFGPDLYIWRLWRPRGGVLAVDCFWIRVSFPGRLGIQHRNVIQALALGAADVGIIVPHLAQTYATAYPHLCTMIPVPGADRFSSTIALG